MCRASSLPGSGLKWFYSFPLSLSWCYTESGQGRGEYHQVSSGFSARCVGGGGKASEQTMVKAEGLEGFRV